MDVARERRKETTLWARATRPRVPGQSAEWIYFFHYQRSGSWALGYQRCKPGRINLQLQAPRKIRKRTGEEARKEHRLCAFRIKIPVAQKSPGNVVHDRNSTTHFPTRKFWLGPNSVKCGGFWKLWDVGKWNFSGVLLFTAFEKI